MSRRDRKGKAELEALRRAVENGKHQVDLDRLAEKLVSHELQRRAMVVAVTRRRATARSRRAEVASTRATPPLRGPGRSRRS